jgi:hypothetical protein
MKTPKLNWYLDTEEGWTEDGVDDAKVARTQYKGYDIDVYPTALLNKNTKGYEYRITNAEKGVDYDSWTESSNGNDHAVNLDEGKKWARNTLEIFLEEEKEKKIKRVKV